jgi:hypothetical protein
MAMRLEIQFKITGWDEVTFSEVEGTGQLSRASVKRAFTGDVEGEGILEYLMSYDDSKAHFIGYERVMGRLGQRVGTFVLQHEGIFEGDVARSSVSIVEGSGTGDLAEITGKGSYEADSSEQHLMTMEVRLGPGKPG